MKNPIRSVLLAVALTGIGTVAAPAHPHVWVDAKSEVVFDKEGRITAIRQVWRFDDAYSAFASQGLDTDGDGKLSVRELKPLADLNVESLKEFGYFTFLMAGGKDRDFGKPTEYWIQDDGGLLTLYFTLPTAEPIPIKGGQAALDVYDPTYYVDFAFVDDGPVTLDGAPAGCTVDVIRPKELDPATAATLAEIPADQRDIPQDLMAVTSELTNGATLKCP
ncbi:DUF1007 family protein [Oharaeibacter diazotrophicus]|uniref:ABC-type uncharacterized transport system substrate-binding protein n=1 Tax=Oharaeibacter diazotrophicus TaxID=1920512 RepID=A0A4V3CW45_9HYPH|nr:DUF1007 family protein [Oharaeibacter diazotrophicus]TDP84908.1 ABC-type uncharacterized transport system substrate-binding protein [Oharaeibacter diazotrophicus]BBE73879.1 hypothetical protein OHA_1_03501 [Pleomorphomonas sp. SM30]GLS76436.1 hypothetical protein GCM10007904_17710 [Oharaeibacter diazotrophicus]